MQKTKEGRIAALLLAVILLLTTTAGCALFGQQEQGLEQQGAEPDRLGSWSQISQIPSRGAAWRQIVTDSPFQLGKKSVKGSWFVPDGTEDYYEIAYGTYPSIDGSTVALPLAVEFARQHLGFSDEYANDFVGFSTTPYAYEHLITKAPNTSAGMIRAETTFLDETHPVDLVIATAPSAAELDAAAQHGVTLVQKPICYDAFVFITHKNNAVDSLTLEQVRGIYTGEITNWAEVGGADAPIVAYQREEGSGSQTAMVEGVMQGRPMLPPTMVKVIAGMGSLVDTVAEYRNDSASIGYTYKYYLDNLYQNEEIKILKIDGVPADEANLRTEAYPLTTCYYGVIRSEDENATGGQFLDWMLSEAGQQCVAQAGYLPL